MRIGITQRVDTVQQYGERRDCLDQRWSKLIIELGATPIPLPNLAVGRVSGLLDDLELDTICFSGGNSLVQPGLESADAAPERDAFEFQLLDEALHRDIPVVGVCRGMQMINVALGGEIVACSGHVAVNHPISAANSRWKLPVEVNSYHNWAITRQGLAAILEPLAFDGEGNVEAFVGQARPILGMMWHPERESPFRALDLQLIEKLLAA